MRVVRELPDQESADLLALTVDLATRELAPVAAAAEATAEFPRELVRLLGKSGLLGLPYPESLGGGEVPFDVYLQVLEELSRGWLSVGLGVSVHTLSCFPVVSAGTADQQAALLPEMLGGDLLGAYCLSEPHCGSDAAALTTVARRDGGDYLIDGVKSWITHAGEADYYMVMARTGEPGPKGSGCLSINASALRGKGLPLPWPRWIPAGSALLPAPSDWRRRQWMWPWTTRGSARRSGNRLAISRGWDSCWPTWQPGSQRRAPSTYPPRGRNKQVDHSAPKQRWRNCSPPTCA